MLLKTSCIQFCAGDNVEANITEVSRLIEQAASQGAKLICTPEMTHLLERKRKHLLAKTHFEQDDPGLRHFCALAKKLSVQLLIGSLAIRYDEDYCVNRSYLLDQSGEVVARYDKIHLFDVDLANGKSFRESSVYKRGSKAVLANFGDIKLGLSICYDLRFPHLYRHLALAGADILCVPAAFTQTTGEAHWHSLLRARAIENGCFVLAPAQCGEHSDGSHSFGHSLIINPWGEVIAEANSSESTTISASLDLSLVTHCRGQIPSLSNNIDFSG